MTLRRLFRPRRWCAILLMLATLAACARATPPQFLESYQGCLVTGSEQIAVELEHAVTPGQRRLGLMERTSLPEHGGMLFFYQSRRPGSAGFWMHRTRIPLDIAWLDGDGQILALDTMEPCDTENASECPSWSPGVPYRQVLEMNAGFFEKAGVAVGDRLVAHLNDNKRCPGAD
ncbi:MAG: DUF192 domain-containing protein [Marinobacter sp.]